MNINYYLYLLPPLRVLHWFSMKKQKDNLAIQKHLFDLLFLIRIRMKDVVQDADSKLSPLQILVLRTLVEDGEMSLITLAQKTGRDKSQITRVVQKLEKKKIIKKERSQLDRRSFILKTNEDVQKEVSFFIHKEHELVAEMLSDIPKNDLQILEKILIQMGDNLK